MVSVKSLSHFLAQSGVDISDPNQRRARVLGWTLLILILLVTAVIVEIIFVTYPADHQSGLLYTALVSALLLILIAAFALNFSGHYSVSAGLTVACAFLGPWASVFLDRSVLRGDVVPLIYITLSLFLSAMLLPVRATAALAIIQFFAVLKISSLVPDSVPINWPSLFAYVLFTSVLAIVFTRISRLDVDQIAKQNALLAESQVSLHELAIRDPLTGLYNRRFLEETLENELEKARRNKVPVGVVIVDVDHFKQINDLYGHAEGDAVLRLVGITLRTHIRVTDFVCRYGGDEFVLILPGASLAITKKRAENLCKEIRNLARESEGLIREEITLSMGVAVFPEHGATYQEIFRAADKALYRSKERGRNCVTLAG